MPDRTAPFDVMILGAGVAGLTAGVHLAAAGLKPLLLEAASTPGGRARSYPDPAFDETLDNGPHLLMGTYQHTLALLSQLNTRHLLQEEAKVRFTFWSRTLGWHTLACPDWPAPWHLLAGLTRFPGLSPADGRAVLRLGFALLKNPEPLEHQSVTQWLQAHRQTDALFQRVWQPLCLATLNEPPGSANATLFATVLRRLFLSHRQAARPLLSRVPLSQLIALPAQRFIEQAGGEVRCGCRVQKLEISGDTLRTVHTRGGILPAAKATIIALPYTALARLLPAWSAHVGLSQLQSAPIVSVHLTYPCPVTLPTSLVGLPFERSQWIVDRGRLQGGTTGGRLSAVMSAAYRERTWSKEKLADTVHQDVVRMRPALASVEPVAARVIKEHRATFATWPETRRYRPDMQTPWRTVWLAGDWIHTGLPATLEGAAHSGVHAARKTLDLWAREG